MSEHKKGMLFALIAFSFWGLFPLYFNAIKSFNALEITSYRIIFSFLTMLFILFFQKKLRTFLNSKNTKNNLKKLLFSTFLIATNWFLFVYAIEKKQVLQTSFGYFISPLFSIFLGTIILKEKLNLLSIIGLILSLVAILIQAFGISGFPWISLTIGITFSLYGLMRKYITIGSLESVAFETGALFIPCIILILYLEKAGSGHYFIASRLDHILIIFSGVATITPLLFFSACARRLPLTTVGFMQYISPSLQFVIGAFILNESLGSAKLISFALIWPACLINAFSSYKKEQ